MVECEGRISATDAPRTSAPAATRLWRFETPPVMSATRPRKPCLTLPSSVHHLSTRICSQNHNGGMHKNAKADKISLICCVQTPRGAKRRRSITPPPGSSPTGHSRAERDEESSLPPSSPPAPFSDTDESLDERDAVKDIEDDADDAEDGDDLFAEEFEEYVIGISRSISRDSHFCIVITQQTSY